jgi:hypothetical protein
MGERKLEERNERNPSGRPFGQCVQDAQPMKGVHFLWTELEFNCKYSTPFLGSFFSLSSSSTMVDIALIVESLDSIDYKQYVIGFTCLIFGFEQYLK